MPLRRPKVYIILLTVMALWAEGASGQGHHSGEKFVAVRAGANLVGNAYRVRETKPEPGAGVSIGSFLSQRWAVEFETWMRASNPECCAPRRTEMLYSVSVVRVLASEGIQPYMLGGLTFLQARPSRAADPDRRRRPSFPSTGVLGWPSMFGATAADRR
jgi:hypothetical protein